MNPKRAALALTCVSVLATPLVLWRALHDTPSLSNDKEPAAPRSSASALPPPLTGPVRYVAIGGGSTPESTEVSLEQDLALAVTTLPGPGTVLFGGGKDALAVRVLDSSLSVTGDGVLTRLGDLFHPRVGRTSRYRKTKLAAKRANLSEVERTLGAALSRRQQGPLTLFVAAHGERGERPRDNYVALWEGGGLTVERLGALHDQNPRPLRVVIAACFSGGFADLAFEHTDEQKGLTRAPRCGLFAGTWDRETSGCDPNPDRRLQENYSVHMLNALKRRDRDGKPLPAAAVDFDGDGHVSLLEAHTRARIASRSLDVPTTTSERFLRAEESRGEKSERFLSAALPGGKKPDPVLLPEERAVIAALGPDLGLDGEKSTRARWEELSERLDALDQGLKEAEEELDRRAGTLAAMLLDRWPILDDPYHPDFATVLARDRSEIARVLGESEEARAHNRAAQQVDVLDAEYYDLEIKEALVLRLLRAHETERLAAALKGRKSKLFEDYRKLLACERGMP